jgi:hypothetical protein
MSSVDPEVLYYELPYSSSRVDPDGAMATARAECPDGWYIAYVQWTDWTVSDEAVHRDGAGNIVTSSRTFEVTMRITANVQPNRGEQA